MRKTLYFGSALAAVMLMAAEKAGGTGKAKPADEVEKPAEETKLEKAIENIAPNSDPNENPNVGRTDLGPAEGQAHSADQRVDLSAAIQAEEAERRRGPTAVEIARHVEDPILLIEAAIAAANADPVYTRNGPLQAFLRHYHMDQVSIREMQGRIEARQERRDAQNEEAKEREKRAG